MGGITSQPFSGPLQQPQRPQQLHRQLSQPPSGPVSATSSLQQTLWGRQGPSRLEPVSTSFNPAHTSVHPEPSTAYSRPRDATHHDLQFENRCLHEEIQRLRDQIEHSRPVAVGQCCCFQPIPIDHLVEHLTRINDTNWGRVQKELKVIQQSLLSLRTNVRDDFSWFVEETKNSRIRGRVCLRFDVEENHNENYDRASQLGCFSPEGVDASLYLAKACTGSHLPITNLKLSNSLMALAHGFSILKICWVFHAID
jgi:hypothetical protein